MAKAKRAVLTPPRPLEREVQAEVLGAAALLGITLQVTDAGLVLRATRGRRHIPGLDPDWPDLTGVVPRGPWRGIALLVEVKRPGETPRPGQRAVLDRLRDEGAIVAWTTDGREAHAWFDAVLSGRPGADEPDLDVAVRGWPR